MFDLLQSFVENGRFLARKSAVLLLLVCALLVAEGCSKKIPCPDIPSQTKKAKKKKKSKVVTPTAGAAAAAAADGGGEATDTAPEESESSSSALEEESAEGQVRKAPSAGAKNHYTKGGLLKKNKYKRLRSNPGKKGRGAKHGKGGKSKTKTKQNNVGPIAE